MPVPAPPFDEIVFPPNISRGSLLGPTYRTIVISVASGADIRIEQASVAVHRFEVQCDQQSAALYTVLKAFFLCRRGKSHGFRFKDWSDYRCVNEPLLVGGQGNPVAGAATVQLVKSYTSGAQTYIRNLYKPDQTTPPTLRKNLGGFGGFTQDTTTGLITLNALNTKAITAVSAPGATTTFTVGAAHGFATNDLVQITGVVGEVQLNGLVGLVTSTAATTITTNTNSIGFSAYVSGGTAIKYLVVSDTLDWTGDFQVPVRLDVDEMLATLEDVDIRSWSSLKMIELIA